MTGRYALLPRVSLSCVVGISLLCSAETRKSLPKKERVGPGHRASAASPSREARRILELMGARGLAAASPDRIEHYESIFRAMDRDADGTVTQRE